MARGDRTIEVVVVEAFHQPWASKSDSLLSDASPTRSSIIQLTSLGRANARDIDSLLDVLYGRLSPKEVNEM
jgi:hypothetical protein